MKRIQRKNVVSIPEDILLRIFKKLPAKPLLRFKCVSNRWCTMIEDSEVVDAFRVRPCNRGTNLLVRRNCSKEEMTIEGRRKFNDFFLLDSDGKFVPLDVPIVLQKTCFFSNEEGNWQHVEGLVHIKNIVWNPTTRKVIHLPPRNPPFWDVSKVIENIGIVAGRDKWKVSSKYFLGYDVSVKKHKVLCICQMWFWLNTIDDGYIEKLDIHESQVSIEVLTLGTNCWKKTTSDYPLPKELFEDFDVKTYCSINSVIYMIISPPSKRYSFSPSSAKDSILAYDVNREKFQLFPLPDGFGGDIKFSAELRGRLALMNEDHKKFWILEEDFEGPRWTVVDLLLPKLWYTTKNSRLAKRVEPVGLNRSGEIFFQVYEVSMYGDTEGSASTIYSYNMEHRAARKVRNLTGLKSFWFGIFPNFVETIQPL